MIKGVLSWDLSPDLQAVTTVQTTLQSWICYISLWDAERTSVKNLNLMRRKQVA
jgi:hypothetical protein